MAFQSRRYEFREISTALESHRTCFLTKTKNLAWSDRSLKQSFTIENEWKGHLILTRTLAYLLSPRWHGIVSVEETDTKF